MGEGTGVEVGGSTVAVGLGGTEVSVGGSGVAVGAALVIVGLGGARVWVGSRDVAVDVALPQPETKSAKTSKARRRRVVFATGLFMEKPQYSSIRKILE